MDFVSPVGRPVILITSPRQPYKIVDEAIANYNDIIVHATGCSWSVACTK